MVSISNSSKRQLSLSMTTTLVFLTHGFVNGLLLSPLNFLRYAFLKDTDYLNDVALDLIDTLLTNLSLRILHTFSLLGCIACMGVGNGILEQRSAFLVCVIIVAQLSSGAFILPVLNQIIAMLQVVVWTTCLCLLTYEFSARNATVTSNQVPLVTLSQLRNSSFDARKKLPIVTMVLTLESISGAVWIIKTAFYKTASIADNPTASILAQVVQIYDIWGVLLLGSSLFLCSPKVQTKLCAVQVVQYFVSIGQGYGRLTSFAGLLLALVGACS